MQNLHTGTSGVNEKIAGATSTPAVTAAVQSENINFAVKNPMTSDPSSDIYYWANTYEKTANYSGAETFTPITNDG